MLKNEDCLRKCFLESLCALSVLAFVLMLLPSAFAQSLTGKWAATDKIMDNGEPNKMLLDLTQSGNNLTGSLTSLGFSVKITGTANGKNFELFAEWDAKKPVVKGEMVGSDLHMTTWDDKKIVARAATAADEIPKPKYIQPPALHSVATNGLSKTPPMGWNSWNKFAGKVDDATIRTIADAMVSSGMRDAGYIYLNIDDTWEGVRDAHGVLQSNHKFPDMKALADYVHSKGLKLGIYSSPGPRTCAGYPGSYGYEAVDAKTWAGWGIDYLKYDWCSAGMVYTDKDLHPVYQKMGDALAASGRSIVYSLCEYGLGEVQKWGPGVSANLWRTTGDIQDNWDSMSKIGFSQGPLAPYAAPGHWNDPDMLEIGNGHMTDDEYRTHMSLWSLLASPLLAGNDIRSMSQGTKDILLNKEVIAIDQDVLGKQAAQLSVHGEVEIWTRPLADGSVAVGVFNRGGSATKASVKLSDLKLAGKVKARDLWSHKDVSFDNGAYSATVPTHGVLLLRMTPAK
jgi:alpha-galactosidase